MEKEEKVDIYKKGFRLSKVIETTSTLKKSLPTKLGIANNLKNKKNGYIPVPFCKTNPERFYLLTLLAQGSRLSL